MMLFKLAIKNIQKSVKDYAIYFFTLVLGVAVFYIFNAIGKQTAMLNLSKSGYQVIKLLNNMLSGVSVFVSFILGFLIIYASRFLIKRRKKEFGVYMCLGMGKGKISRILLCETILIGCISLIIGLGIGIALSQVMSVVVSNMFEADMTAYRFIYSNEATLKTVLYFGIMYVLVMLFNAFSISKCKLIDLLQGGRKNEKIKIKNPYICIIIFIISVIMLGVAYYHVTLGYDKMTNKILYLSIGLGAVGTFLLFWSLSGLILKIVSSIKGIYRKDLNTFVLRQLDSKINTTVFSMTIICLMLFLTIGVLSTALTLNDTLRKDLKTLIPIDVQLSQVWDLDKEATTPGDQHINTPEQIEQSHESAKEVVEGLGFNTDKELKDKFEYNTYRDSTVTAGGSMGIYYDELKKDFPMFMDDTPIELIRISDYNKLAKLFGHKTLSVKDDEYIMLCDYETMLKYRNKALKAGTKVTINDKVYKPKYKKSVESFIDMTPSKMNIGVIILPDNAVDESMRYRSCLAANYQAEGKDAKMDTENKLQNLEDDENQTNLYAFTKISLYESSVGLGAMVAFIGLYLGIIFLISSAAILALKELSDSTDNKERFDVLRKIGADERMINRSLFRQIGIFFLFPLLIAGIHSVFGIQFVNKAMVAFVSDGMLPSIIMTAIILIVIYGGYFLITYLCSKNIIKDKNL